MKDQPEVVVITGASAGVGRATVREFAKRGAHIGLIARGRDGLEAARREGGIRPLVSQHSVASGVLRGQARRAWFHGFAALRINPRRQQRPGDHGADAGAEYAAIRLDESRLPRKAQPVPPIFQPEVAAEAIYWAAPQRRREVFVRLPTTKAIVGNKIIPGLLDHYLANAAYDGQQTDEPEDPERPHNLMEPLPGDHGAHGTFDKRASASCPAFWAVKHRVSLGAVAGGVLAVAFTAALKACVRRSDWQSHLLTSLHFRGLVKTAARMRDRK